MLFELECLSEEMDRGISCVCVCVGDRERRTLLLALFTVHLVVTCAAVMVGHPREIEMRPV